jgi:hypothetical protein
MNQRLSSLLAATVVLAASSHSPEPSRDGAGSPASPLDRAAKLDARLARRERLVAKAEAKRARKAKNRATTAPAQLENSDVPAVSSTEDQ